MLETIPDFPIFKDLPQEILTRLENKMTMMECQDKDVIWSEGDDPDAVYFVFEGGIIGSHIGTNGQMHVSVLWDKGVLCGHTACLTNMPRTEELTANGKTILGKLGRETFLDLFIHVPELSRYLAQHMAHDIRNLIISSTSRAVLSSKEVVAFDLLRRRAQCHSLVFEVPLQKYWAPHLGLTRETLSRALSFLVKKGLIETSGRQLTICDIEGLKEIGGDVV